MRQELKTTAMVNGGERYFTTASSYVTQRAPDGALWVCYDSGMKQSLGLFFLFFVAAVGVAQAFEVIETTVVRPYDVVEIVPVEDSQVVHMGKLEGFPVMYEFSVDDPEELSLQLRTLASKAPGGVFSLMIVRVNDDGSGVSEIARQTPIDNAWVSRKDSAFGLTFLEGEVLKLAYEPGTYRVEVSTPVNEGAYLLAVGGSTGNAGYFSMLGNIYAVQKHFGYSVVRMIGSSYVYYPLGILLLLFALQRTWMLRNRIAHA
jgi:hypothetical protein